MESSSDDLEIQPYEKEHIKILRDNSSECTLFLKKNDSFPLSEQCKVLLIGSGARNTIKGGAGSGEVDSRFFITCEQGLESAGFEIVSKDWLDKFPEFKKSKRTSFINNVKEEAENLKAIMPMYAWGIIQPEAEYNLPLDVYNADIAIYVLSRMCGEGADRRLIKGDVYLTDSEIKDIYI
jgi:beta-glucosidase